MQDPQPEQQGYYVALHADALIDAAKYLQDLKTGEKTAGTRLQQALREKDLANMTTQEFLSCLLATKETVLFAEDDPRIHEWTLDEISILGDISTVVPHCTAFDTANQGVQEYREHSQEIFLTVTNSPLLTADNLYTPDLKAVTDEHGNIDQKKYNSLIERRLLATLQAMSDDGKREGKPKIFMCPGLGCGQFAGSYAKIIRTHLNEALKACLEKHARHLPGIKAVIFDGWQHTPKEGPLKLQGITYLATDASYRDNRALLSPVNKLERECGIGEGTCSLSSTIAGDHVAKVGNDFNDGSPNTVEGRFAASTDVLSKITGVEGQYTNQGSFKRPSNIPKAFCPKTGTQWANAYQGRPLTANVCMVVDADGRMSRLNGNQLVLQEAPALHAHTPHVPTPAPTPPTPHAHSAPAPAPAPAIPARPLVRTSTRGVGPSRFDQDKEEYIVPPSLDPAEIRVTINYVSPPMARIIDGLEPGCRITVDDGTAEKINSAQKGLGRDELFLIPHSREKNTFTVKYSHKGWGSPEPDFGFYHNSKGERCIKLPRNSKYMEVVNVLLGILPEPIRDQAEFDKKKKGLPLLVYRPSQGLHGHNTLYISPDLCHGKYVKKGVHITSGKVETLGQDEILVQALKDRYTGGDRIAIRAGQDLADRIREKLQEFPRQTLLEEEEDGVFVVKASAGQGTAGTYRPLNQRKEPKPDEIGISFSGVDSRLTSLVTGLLSPSRVNSRQNVFDQTKGTNPTAMYIPVGSTSIYVPYNFQSKHKVPQDRLTPTLPPVLGPYDFQFFCTADKDFRLYVGPELRKLIQEMNPKMRLTSLFYINEEGPYVHIPGRTLDGRVPLHISEGLHLTEEEKRCVELFNMMSDRVTLKYKSGSYPRALSPKTNLPENLLSSFRKSAVALPKEASRETSSHLSASSAPTPHRENAKIGGNKRSSPQPPVAPPYGGRLNERLMEMAKEVTVIGEKVRTALGKVTDSTFKDVLQQVLELLGNLMDRIEQTIKTSITPRLTRSRSGSHRSSPGIESF